MSQFWTKSLELEALTGSARAVRALCAVENLQYIRMHPPFPSLGFFTLLYTLQVALIPNSLLHPPILSHYPNPLLPPLLYPSIYALILYHP